MRRWWPRLRAGWTGKINRNSSYPPSISSSSAWGMWLPSSPAFYSNEDYSDCQGKGTFLLRHWRRRRWNSLVNLWRKNFRYSCKCILSLNILSLATCSEEECQTSEKHAVDGIFSNDTASPDIPRKCKCHRISGCSGRTKLKMFPIGNLWSRWHVYSIGGSRGEEELHYLSPFHIKSSIHHDWWVLSWQIDVPIRGQL